MFIGSRANKEEPVTGSDRKNGIGSKISSSANKVGFKFQKLETDYNKVSSRFKV